MYSVYICWSEEDRAYVAEVPELPGCAADGKTQVEALENVQVVIQDWLELARKLNRTIPQPRNVYEPEAVRRIANPSA